MSAREDVCGGERGGVLNAMEKQDTVCRRYEEDAAKKVFVVKVEPWGGREKPEKAKGRNVYLALGLAMGMFSSLLLDSGET